MGPTSTWPTCAHAFAKRAPTVAGAAGHNVLRIGSPGTGKSMPAARQPTALPPLTEAESLETTTSAAPPAGRTSTSRC